MMRVAWIAFLVPHLLAAQDTEDEFKKKQAEIAAYLKTAKAEREFRAAVMDLAALAEKASAARKYDLATKVYADAERISRTALADPGQAKGYQDAAKRMTDIGKEFQKAAKAVERIIAKEGTPEDYTASGKFLCFVAGDWTLGIEDLSKGKDAALQKLAQMDLAGAQDADGMVAIGDAWAARKEPAAKERSASWFGRAWPLLSGISKEKIRTKFRAIYIKGPSKKKAPEAMTFAGTAKDRYFLDDGVAHDGKYSLQLVPGTGATFATLPTKRPLVPGQTYKLTAWALSDESTATDGGFYVRYAEPKGGAHIWTNAPTDQPWWTKVEKTFTLPADAKVDVVGVAPGNGKGFVWLDDLSIRGEDGTEFLVDGGFEK